MTNETEVLIISTSVDLATDRVVERFSQLGQPFFRLNTEDLGRKHISWKDGAICFGDDIGRRFKSVWFRRLRGIISPDVDPEVNAYVTNEFHSALRGGLLSSLSRERCYWMSWPPSIEIAEHKIFQLNVAKELGFLVPETIVSSNPSDLLTFYNRFKASDGYIIGKPIRSGYLALGEKGFGIFTRVFSKRDIDRIDNAVSCPIILQPLIEKRYDIRVTVVKDRIYSAAIDSQKDPVAVVDWRKTENAELPHYPHELPGTLKNRIIQMMEVLDLSFGAWDFILTPSGEYYFLEINPSGQWLWIEDALNFPISNSVAEVLCGS